MSAEKPASTPVVRSLRRMMLLWCVPSFYFFGLGLWRYMAPDSAMQWVYASWPLIELLSPFNPNFDAVYAKILNLGAERKALHVLHFITLAWPYMWVMMVWFIVWLIFKGRDFRISFARLYVQRARSENKFSRWCREALKILGGMIIIPITWTIFPTSLHDLTDSGGRFDLYGNKGFLGLVIIFPIMMVPLVLLSAAFLKRLYRGELFTSDVA